MKDEEMAEEYKEKQICNTCADIQDCGNDCPFSRCGVQGFLAGLKAGRPQWHDLQEYPNDLPKGDGGSVSESVLKEDGMVVHYNFWEKHWETSAYVRMKEPPVAWCEIPTFDKE